MADLGWLTARPIAHRGLHDAARGIIENTASAFVAAIDGGYGMETDVQLSRDGEAMVHHDDVLGRLTDGSGPLAALTAAELARVPFRATQDRMLTLGELCDRVAGRATLVVEIKSRGDRDDRLVDRTAEVLKAYTGPVAAMSFDRHVAARLRHMAPALARGIVAERRHDYPSWRYLGGARPDFVAYAVDDLPAPITRLARWFGVPVLAWTVRTPEQRERAKRCADQIIFEGFAP